MLDARWDKQFTSIPGEYVSLSAVQNYAESKNVSLWLWVNSGGDNNNASISTKSPKDLLWQPDIRRKVLSELAGHHGISGLKMDGIQSDKQEMISYRLDIFHDAATAKMLVVFHNCPTPKGWERTWPNLLSIEALVTSEFYANAILDNGEQMTENNVNQAFVRYPIGPADYSPGTFSRDLYKNDKLITTDAHELALNVIIDSGLRLLPDTPEAYDSRKNITRILTDFPFVWKQTTNLAGEPGRYFCIAKHAGDAIYVAAINGETTFISPPTNISDPTWNPAAGLSRDVTIDLEKLIPDTEQGAVPVTVVADAPGSKDAAILETQLDALLTNGSQLTFHMNAFGGFVAKIGIH